MSLFSSKWYLLFRGVLVVIGGFIVHLALGSVTTFGNMAPYIQAYVTNQTYTADLKPGVITWIYASIYVGLGVFNILGGWLVKKIGPRWITLIGGWTMSLGVGLTYFSLQAPRPLPFPFTLFTYGIMQGAGVGTAYIGPISAAMKWMPQCKGIASGIITVGYGLSPLLFDMIQTALINPGDVSICMYKCPYDHDDSIQDHLPTAFAILAGIYAAMVFVGSILITDPPMEYQTEPPVETVDTSKVAEIDDEFQDLCLMRKCYEKCSACCYAMKNTIPFKFITKSQHREEHLLRDKSTFTDFDSDGEEVVWSNQYVIDELISLTARQALRRPYFYVLWFSYLMNDIVTVFFESFFKYFGMSFISNDTFLALSGSMGGLFNSIGRISCGVLSDKLSYKYVLVAVFSVMSLAVYSVYICVFLDKSFYLIWTCVIFFTIGGNSVIFATAVGRAYGVQHVSVNYGIILSGRTFAGPIVAVMFMILIPFISYLTLFLIFGAFSTLGLFLSVVYKPKHYVLVEKRFPAGKAAASSEDEQESST